VADGLRARIHEALTHRGFAPDFSVPGRHGYAGVIDRGNLDIPVRIDVQDLDFVDLPVIAIDRSYRLPSRAVPHLGQDREICYFAKGTIVPDRYDPGGAVLMCLDRAEKVIRDAIRGRSDIDFADEFAAYWNATSMLLLDLPADHVGPATAYFVVLGSDESLTRVLALKSTWALRMHRGPKNVARITEPALVVRMDRPLTLDPSGSWPPADLAAINRWLDYAAPEHVGAIERFMAGIEGHSAILAMRTPNGVYGWRMEVPRRFRTTEFLKTRRVVLPDVLRRHAALVGIERLAFDEAGIAHIYGRNMGSRMNLTGKKILLVGCGTIGGFLAQQLAQSGAGAGSGYMTLADSETLRTANIGRHLLGVPYLDRNKAEACAEFLNAQLPGLAIEAHGGDVRKLRKPPTGYDLVIDATGEEALSFALNARAISERPKSPPHLFVWLLSNGVAAQAILTGEPDRACLKCLNPAIGGEPRFRILRDPGKMEIGSNLACADPHYIPYPVSRSVAAAALACDLVLDWANGDPGHRLRNHVFDHKAAFRVESSSPAPSKSCPACGSPG
jgi:molybdopterin/thiamine biosynthesis adenylyltransferase